MLCFNLIMLALAVIAYYPAPKVRGLAPFYFFVSWLPSELPWLFGVVQTLAIIVFVLLRDNWCAVDISAMVIALLALVLWYRLHQKTFTAGVTFSQALKPFMNNENAESIHNLSNNNVGLIARRDWLKPFSFHRAGVEVIYDVAYGEQPRQQLDIYYSQNNASVNNQIIKRPVLLHVHGGAWIVGHKKQQAQPLINYMAQQGWLCVDINYRLAPKDRFPACLVDVKTAIVWLKNNIAAYGGDPEFIAITGESAGGHLCALAALTANQPEFQPGFEQCDTQVQAAVPLYGIYDFTNTNKARDGVTLDKFLSRCVMPCTLEDDPDYWRKASPLHQVSEKAPPLFVIQGANDCLALVEEAQTFVGVLQTKSKAPVVYAELAGAQHAFEIFHGVRAEFTIEAIGIFLCSCYKNCIDRSPRRPWRSICEKIHRI